LNHRIPLEKKMASQDNTPSAASDNQSPAAAAPDAAPETDRAPERRKLSRKRALLGVTGLVAAGGIAYGAYWALVLNHYESTDNAYVQGNVVQITPQVGGTVVAIGADDTDHVQAGQVIVKLDPADAQVALDQAEAQLAQTVREVRTLYVNNGTLRSQINARAADVAKAQADVARAQDDVARRAPLVATGAVGKEEFAHATAQLNAAKSALVAAQSAQSAAEEQLTSNQTLTEGIPVDRHPNVERAAARVREAYLALQRADLKAPVDGFVAKRSVQLGQRVQAGAPLMSVVALSQVWVEANFKESQLQNLRIGQPAELIADVYGKKVRYHGTIEGLGAGTGSAFSLLPAQNATGNWIKVVQRVPVRIALDANELTEHPLRVGLSMDAKVDTKDTSGRMLAEAKREAPAVAPQAITDPAKDAVDAEVRKIILANSGAAAAARATALARSEARATAVASRATTDRRNVALLAHATAAAPTANK
jgi:membrane fusion protein (multidrug efflux system)